MKKFFLILIGVLAMTSCTTDDTEPLVPDEQHGEHSIGGSMLLATPGFPGYPEMIYNSEGDTIYQCDDIQSQILSLATDGGDWYAQLSHDDGTYSLVRNGETVYTTPRVIATMAVEGGIVYTVEIDKQDDTRWVYRNFQQLYELDTNVNYYTFNVQDGNISFTVNAERPYTWWNGRTYSFEGLDEGFGYTYGMDRNGTDVLILYEEYNSRQYKYYWNGTVHDLPERFNPTTCRIVNGHAFVLGRKLTSSGVGGMNGVPAVIIDGVETLLSDQKGFAAVKLANQRMDTYILVNNVLSDSGRSMLYKNMQQVNLPSNIAIPENLLKYYTQYGTTINAVELGITDIAILKTKN